MKQTEFTILKNEPLSPTVQRLVLAGDTAGIAPGQFVNVAVPGKFLRRPISVCDCQGEELTLLYKVVGGGTALLREQGPGQRLDLLTGLGNGYDLSRAGERPLLIGGGVGVPPLYLLAKKLLEAGKAVQVVLGFNTAQEIFYEFTFRALGCPVTVTTVDGSYGVQGFVTDALPEEYTHFYACGPLPMLRAVYKKTTTEGQFSLEERMGCGFGACMGCTVETKNGPRRVCHDGPVFGKGELTWDD